MALSLYDLLKRIKLIGDKLPCEGDWRSLLHAYVACLHFSELCTAIAMTFDANASVRLALRTRLLRLLRNNPTDQDIADLVELVEQTKIEDDRHRKHRQAVDALHSAVFEYLPLPIKQMVLDRWINRGTRGAAARWLKATKSNPDLFDTNIAINYWRQSNDYRFIRSLANQAPAEKLLSVLPELLDSCEEGWVISKVVLRTETTDEDCWDKILNHHPATYLYLCSQTGRHVGEEEAFDLVCQCSNFRNDGERGLAIWAIGQMQMTAVLDRIQEVVDDLHQKDADEWFASTGITLIQSE